MHLEHTRRFWKSKRPCPSLGEARATRCTRGLRPVSPCIRRSLEASRSHTSFLEGMNQVYFSGLQQSPQKHHELFLYFVSFTIFQFHKAPTDLFRAIETEASPLVIESKVRNAEVATPGIERSSAPYTQNHRLPLSPQQGEVPTVWGPSR